MALPGAEAPPPPGPARRGERPVPAQVLAAYWPLIALTVAVAVMTVVARHVLFPAFSWNRDEPVYLWHMEVLRSGQLTSTDGGAPLFFRPWLSGAADGALFSQYTLGWPIVLLVAATVLGSPAAALPLGAVLAVVGTYAFTREVTSDHTLAAVSAAVLAACPVVAIQGGMYLGYLFTLGLGLLFAATLLSGVRRRRHVRLVVSGALLGWIFMTRPLDALLWGTAVVGYLAYTRRREWRRLVRAIPWLVAGLAPLVVATLAYNAHVTGGLLQFPVTATDPLDSYGFGPRRIMPATKIMDYGPRTAVLASAKNGALLPLFLTGSYLGVLVALRGLWLRRRDRSSIALLAVGIVFPLGYFPFWGTRLSSDLAKYSGPFYYLPLYVPLSILIATVVIAQWRHRRAHGIALLLVLLIATVPAAVNRFDQNRRQSEAQVPWKESTASIEGPALVFLADDDKYLMRVNPYASNTPDLDGELLFAADRGAENLDLIAAMPWRAPVRQQASVPLDTLLLPDTHPETPEITTTRLHVLRGTQVALDVRATNTTSSSTVVVSLVVGARVEEQRTLSTRSEKGATHATRWLLRVPGVETSGSSIPLPGRRGRVAVIVGFGTDVASARRDPVARHAIPYRIDSGSAELLLPAELDREIWRTARLDWRRVADVPELEVVASAVPAGG